MSTYREDVVWYAVMHARLCLYVQSGAQKRNCGTVLSWLAMHVGHVIIGVDSGRAFATPTTQKNALPISLVVGLVVTTNTCKVSVH